MDKKSLRTLRAIMASGLLLFLLGAMLLSTTVAWFSDSVTNSGNTITAGTIKIGEETEGYLFNGNVVDTANGKAFDGSGTLPLITEEAMQAGDFHSAFFAVDSSTSSLSFDYKLRLEINGIKDADKADVTLTSAIVKKYTDCFWFRASRIDSLGSEAPLTAAPVPLPETLTVKEEQKTAVVEGGAATTHYYIDLYDKTIDEINYLAAPAKSTLPIYLRLDYGMRPSDDWTSDITVFSSQINFSIVIEADQIIPPAESGS